MGVYYPRHLLRIAAVLEDFAAGATSIDQAVEWTCVPRRARLERNDIHTADRLQLDLDFREFPFDPRLVRAASVAYFAADTGGRSLDATDRSLLRFVGVVDVPEMGLGEDDQRVSLECRDYTALLLGVRAGAEMAVALDRPMDDVLGELLAGLPGEQASALRLVLRPDGTAWPTVSAGGRHGARLVVEPKDTLWSLVRRVVEQSGLVVFVELDQLVVSTPRNADGTQRPAHAVFGRNLTSLRMRRNTQNLTRPVRLTQYDPATRQTTSATFPPLEGAGGRSRTGTRPSVAIRATPGATVASQAAEAEEFAVRGHCTEDELRQGAERVYRARARTEIEGSLSTAEMRLPTVDADRQPTGQTLDVLGLSTNDTLVVEIGEQARLAFDARRDSASRARELIRLGYPATVAGALVRSWEHLDRIRLPFVVRKATFTLDENSFGADVDFQNLLSPFVAGETTPREMGPSLGAGIDAAIDAAAASAARDSERFARMGAS